MQSKTVKRFVNVTAWLVQECWRGDLCKNLGVGEHCFQFLLLLVLLRSNIKRMKKKMTVFCPN